jgi:hypothetical protein
MKWYQLAYAARLYQRGGGWVELTASDFAAMVENFERNPNRFVRVEGGEHGSPEVVGRIVALETRPGVNPYTGESAETLWGQVEWRPDAVDMIRAGNWTSVSIEAHSHRDPVTGKDAGRRLAAVALLPPDAEFLKGMERIAASESAACADRVECGMVLTEIAAVDTDDGEKSKDPEGITMDWEQILTALRGGADLDDATRQGIADFLEAEKAKAETMAAEAEAKAAEAAAKAEEVAKAEGETVALSETAKAAKAEVVKLSERVAKLEAEKAKAEAQAAALEADRYLDSQADRFEPAERDTLKKLLLSEAGADVRAMIEARSVRPELRKPEGVAEEGADEKLVFSERVEGIMKEHGITRQAAWKRARREQEGN